MTDWRDDWRKPAAIFGAVGTIIAVATFFGFKPDSGGSSCTISGQVFHQDGSPAAGDSVGYVRDTAFEQLATIDPKGAFEANCDAVAVDTPNWSLAVLTILPQRGSCIWSHPNYIYSKAGDHKGITIFIDPIDCDP